MWSGNVYKPCICCYREKEEQKRLKEKEKEEKDKLAAAEKVWLLCEHVFVLYIVLHIHAVESQGKVFRILPETIQTADYTSGMCIFKIITIIWTFPCTLLLANDPVL